MKTIKCICDICGNEFEKPQNEYNRRIKLGKTKLYCSLKCSGNRKENVEMIYQSGKQYHFKGGENKLMTPDEITLGGLKEFSRRVRRRSKFVEELLPTDLLKIWKKQKGKCAITKVDLLLPNDIRYKLVNNNYKASIDRVDSSKPYTIDNIQFLSATMNYLKMDMNDSDVNEFFEIISRNRAEVAH
jgi:hypothetical protein